MCWVWIVKCDSTCTINNTNYECIPFSYLGCVCLCAHKLHHVKGVDVAHVTYLYVYNAKHTCVSECQDGIVSQSTWKLESTDLSTSVTCISESVTTARVYYTLMIRPCDATGSGAAWKLESCCTNLCQHSDMGEVAGKSHVLPFLSNISLVFLCTSLSLKALSIDGTWCNGLLQVLETLNAEHYTKRMGILRPPHCKLHVWRNVCVCVCMCALTER